MISDVCIRILIFGLLCVTISQSFRFAGSPVAFHLAYRNLLPAYKQFQDANVALGNGTHAEFRVLAYVDSPGSDGATNTFESNEITLANEQGDFHVDEELIHDACQLYRSVLGWVSTKVHYKCLGSKTSASI